jgi:acetylornithine/succinyldiaminopimelate/putrescine aminotransferase/predicted amino acid dehydrogenase
MDIIDVNENVLPVAGTLSDAADENLESISNFREYCRPKLADMLGCLRLNTPYTRARGNYLYYNKVLQNGLQETAVLDFVGGFGANLLGHNNPILKETLIECLDNDLPNHSQGSVRGVAAQLAQKLNELVPSKSKYICNFTNSGTESVEAALKHAFKSRGDQIQRKFESISTNLNVIQNYFDLESPGYHLPDSYSDISVVINHINEHNLKQLNQYLENPIICAFKSAFHGKTTSLLKVTFNKTFRESYEGMSALKTVFIDTDCPDQLESLAKEHLIVFKYIEIVNEQVLIKTWEIPGIFAFIMEVILGEGGILILKDSVMAELASIYKRVNIPFIIDEIQTGCGRTGTFFAYEQTPLKDIEPDYITLSKALGGGLTKIGVAMIHEKGYDPDFGLVHTSTFAEDDMSSAVAIKVIDLLTADNQKLMHETTSKGALIKKKLEALKQKFPDVIKDVRGQGLMIGIELTSLGNYSPFFRYAGSQGFIALLISSYLLHYHNIRVSSPLTTLFKGNPGKKRPPVIRIQPSVFITEEEIDELVYALNEVLNLIVNNNEFVLLAHLINAELSDQMRQNPDTFPVVYPFQKPRKDISARIGFIVHITELQYLIDYYLPSFKQYSFQRRTLIKWWDTLCRFLDPDLMHRAYITSNGKTVEANLVCVPFLPKYMIRTYAEGKLPPEQGKEYKNLLMDMQDKIQDAVLFARDLGDTDIPVKIVGLGAYNSIVTDNSLSLNDNEVAVTTGNAFTTALTYLGICEAVQKQNATMSNLSAAVVGATGNIGSALTSLIGTEVKKIYIIGRDKVQSYDRLTKTKELCLSRILENVRLQISAGIALDEIKLRGFSAKLYADIILPILKKGAGQSGPLMPIFEEVHGEKLVSPHTGKLLDDLIKKYYYQGDNPFIEIADMSVLKSCDIIALATNSSDSWFLKPDDLKEGSIVCCASVPSNLSETFKDKTDKFFVFDGGYALLPDNSQIDFIGMPKYGNAYGCLAETLLMGFDGQSKSFARGEITVSQITKTIELADKYGFKLGKYLLGDDIHRMVT